MAERLKDISSSLTEINQQTKSNVDNAEKGNELASNTAQQLEEMATASKEQAQGVQQINNGLEQNDQVTQPNTASAEESASAAEELASQSQQLKALISRFKLKGNGSSGGNGHDKALETQYIEPVAAKIAEKPKADPKEVIDLDNKKFGKF